MVEVETVEPFFPRLRQALKRAELRESGGVFTCQDLTLETWRTLPVPIGLAPLPDRSLGSRREPRLGAIPRRKSACRG
jgi:hypothetical protein